MEALELVLRLSAAVLVGGAIGLNRDMHRKPAGVRTHALVSLGAALIVLVALPPADAGFPQHPDALSRVVQGVLTGIGFLGAGVILHAPEQHRISGLTTAATIWVTALLGVACGLGAWKPLGLAFLLGALVLGLGGRLERAFRRRGVRADDEVPPP